jgi:hypothetical protein
MRHVRWSDQPEERTEGMDFKKKQWFLLVDDFVRRFNLHQVTDVQPLKQICVDESMSRWYSMELEGIIDFGIP